MGINYKQIIKDLLKDYVRIKSFMQDNLDRLGQLEASKEKITPTYGKIAYQSTPTPADDKLLSINADIDLLKENIEDNLKVIDKVEYAMKDLSDMEKDIVITMYGKPYDGRKLYEMTEKYSYEKTTIYKIANESIMKMSYTLYGDS